jgi:hypothetical protein
MLVIVLVEYRASDRRQASFLNAGPAEESTYGCENRSNAERVADLLNRLDPAHFKPPQKGPHFGWF